MFALFLLVIILQSAFAQKPPGDNRCESSTSMEVGPVRAAFDNEPTHINGYHLAFPEAQAVHLLTDESGRDVEVLPQIPSVTDFLLPS